MIKQSYSIKDLENLSGIKSHTLRIWEKRHDILSPERSSTNIRSYDSAALRKVLNIGFLRDKGYKISKIAEHSDKELEQLVQQYAFALNDRSYDIQQLKLAMVNYNKERFENTIERSIESRGFEGTFSKVIVPFLIEIGLLWHSSTIKVAHEHFISQLIRRKILSFTDRLPKKQPAENNPLHILYLPLNEMHDLGLLYLNYLLIKNNRQTIYLGTSMDINELRDLGLYSKEIVFITYFTLAPSADSLKSYLKSFNRKIQSEENMKLWILGNVAKNIDPDWLYDDQYAFSELDSVLQHLNIQIN